MKQPLTPQDLERVRAIAQEYERKYRQQQTAPGSASQAQKQLRRQQQKTPGQRSSKQKQGGLYPPLTPTPGLYLQKKRKQADPPADNAADACAVS
jgi:hypothetical protein